MDNTKNSNSAPLFSALGLSSQLLKAIGDQGILCLH